MDDIKPPGHVPTKRPRAPAPKQPTYEENAMHEPEMPMHEETFRRQEKPKGGMKTWLVVLLVVLALAIGAGGVYLWQSSGSTLGETEALQSQINTLKQDLSEAKQAAADNTLEAKDKEIETLGLEKVELKNSNDALKTRNTELTTNCAAEGLDADCKASTAP